MMFTQNMLTRNANRKTLANESDKTGKTLSKFVTMVTSIEAQRIPYYKPLDANNSSGFR